MTRPAEHVVEAWSIVLGQNAPVDATTDFFEAGGDSLALVELVEILESSDDAELDLDTFLDDPTLGTLTELCARSGST